MCLIGNDIDNMPATILEACASGLPVVTTNAGGIPYLVEHESSALIVERGAHAEMARAVLRLLADGELAQRLAHHAHTLAQQCTWERVRDQWLSLYFALTHPQSARHNEGCATLPQRS